jgi:uncharacterized protein (DUF2249 family)
MPPVSFEPRDSRISVWGSPDRFHLDVRSLLIEGGEPYAVIMECVRTLEPGDTLTVHAIMQPQPLLRQLTRMGLTFQTRHAGPDHWEVEIRDSTEEAD